MPFGLTNVSTTFQVMMNDILLLVFFDDILIHISLWSEHLRHAQIVFWTL
jgi:hypothetical protein